MKPEIAELGDDYYINGHLCSTKKFKLVRKNYLKDLKMENNDDTVVYLIVKSSLNMSVGKIVAQAVHAFDGLNIDPHDCGIKEVMNWHNSNKRIVSLQANDKEFEKIKFEYPKCYVVVDAGLTEISPGSETVIALQPMKKSERTKTLKRLQVLKDKKEEQIQKYLDILKEAWEQDPEHMIECHKEHVNSGYLKMAKAIDIVLHLHSEEIMKRFDI